MFLCNKMFNKGEEIMRKKLIVKVLSALMIVYFITANGGIQPMVAKATETLATGVTYSFEVEGILWNYEVDDMMIVLIKNF